MNIATDDLPTKSSLESWINGERYQAFQRGNQKDKRTNNDLLNITQKTSITVQGLKYPLVRGPGPAICGFGPNIF
jgi:hypothetical protein